MTSPNCRSMSLMLIDPPIMGRAWTIDRLARHVKTFVGQIADARSETEAEQVAESEDVIGEAGRIGVVLLDPQVGLVIEQAIENMRRIANGCVDDFGMEGRVLVGDVSVEVTPGSLPYFGSLVQWLRRGLRRDSAVHRTKKWFLRPNDGERNLMVIVDDFGQCFRVSLVADMPGYKPGQFSDTCARTRLGHFAQTQVGSVSQNGRQQQYWIFRWIGGLEMNEMAGETCPVVHFHQQVRDFDMGSILLRASRRASASFGTLFSSGLILSPAVFNSASGN